MAEKKKEAVKFYFPKGKRASYITNQFVVQAEDHIYIADPGNKKYAQIVKFLRDHKENVANKGHKFIEIASNTEETDRGLLLDNLMALDVPQLRRLCAAGKSAEVVMEMGLINSKGQLIDMYMRAQDSVEEGK